MTTTPPSARFTVSVDRPDSDYVKIPHDFSRGTLPPSAKTVALYLASHSSTFQLTKSGIGTALGMSRNTVKSALQTLVDEGHLQIIGTVYRLTLVKNCAEGGQKLTSEVVKNGAHKKITEKITQEIDKNTRSAEPTAEDLPVDKSMGNGLSTAQARAWLDGEKTAEAHPIHLQWQPNSKHTEKASELGLDVSALAEQFHAGFTVSGEKRDNWGSTFTAYLRETAEAVEKVTFTGADIDAVEDVQAQQVTAKFQELCTQQDVFGSTSEQVTAEQVEDPWAGYVAPAPALVAVAAPIEEPVAVAEVVATPAPVVALAPSPTRAASQTDRLKRDIRKPWQREDVVLAHELFEAGQRYDSVKDSVKAQMAARKARIENELANHRAVPLPVSA